MLIAVGATTLSADVCIPFPVSIDLNVSADTFRSLPEGSWINNDGAYVALNIGFPLPYLQCYGLGGQFGSSWGAYDWNGRESSPFGNRRAAQQQVFLTTGFFWKTTCASGINLGVVYDWMFNKYFGAFGVQVDMAQVRYQAGFLWDCSDEFGIWGANPVHTAERMPGGDLAQFRGINQINLYWQHNFENCAYTMLWVGLPYGGLRPAEGPVPKHYRSGQFVAGARMGAPLTSAFSIEGHASYMHPTTTFIHEQSQDYAFNVTIGITYSFGGAGLCDDYGVRPYLPLADNSSFIVDTNKNY